MMELQPSTSRDKSSDLTSPKKKRPKVTSFTVNEKNMVINTYKNIKETWPNDKYPYRKEMAQKTASILGIGVASVYRILKEYKEHGEISPPVTTKPRPTFSDKIDDFTKSAIREKVHAYFLKGELPTVKKVLSDINEDNTLPSFKRSTFQKILIHLKLRYVKRQRSNALILKYLHKIKNREENNTFKFQKVKSLLSDGMPKVTPDRQKKCVEQVQKEEEKLFKLDFIVDDVTDKSICVTSSDSDSTDTAKSASD